jgi:hypothetical protein
VTLPFALPLPLPLALPAAGDAAAAAAAAATGGDVTEMDRIMPPSVTSQRMPRVVSYGLAPFYYYNSA